MERWAARQLSRVRITLWRIWNQPELMTERFSALPCSVFGTLIAAALIAACGGRFSGLPPAAPTTFIPRSIDSISLDHTPCFGLCPVYRYVLRNNGTASLVAAAFLPIRGHYTAPLDTAVFSGLVKKLREKKFFEMSELYAVDVTDQSSTITSVYSNDRSRRIAVYGAPGNVPRELYDIVTVIEETAAELHWKWIGPAP